MPAFKGLIGNIRNQAFKGLIGNIRNQAFKGLLGNIRNLAFKGLMGNIRNHPTVHRYHRSKSGIPLDNLVISHQIAKQKRRISSSLIEMRHFFLVFLDTNNLLTFFQK